MTASPVLKLAWGNYVIHSLEMRESPAWRACPDKARRLLDSMEVEHMRGKGRKNGALKNTYNDIRASGIRGEIIREMIEIAVQLGFLRVVTRGRPSRMDVRTPSVYRLTYVQSANNNPPPTHEWMDIKDDAAARAAIKRARNIVAQEREADRARKLAKKIRREEAEAADKAAKSVSPGRLGNL